MPDDATLFVIFHGTWCFLDTPDYVYVKTPEVRDHVYRAGYWAAEHELPQGSYYRFTDNITGDSTVCIDPTCHPVIKSAKLANTTHHRGSHTTLLLAKPQKWYPVAQGFLKAGQLVIHDGQIISQDGSDPGGTHDPSKLQTKVSFYHVFQYSYDTSCPPSLPDLGWKAYAIEDYHGRGNVATLHFFAEHEDKESGKGHFTGAFQDGSRILGADLSVATDTVRVSPLDLPPLLEHRYFEFLDLSSRKEHLKNMGFGLAEQKPNGHPSRDALESYWPLTVPRTKDLPAATCLPVGGSGGGC